MPCQSSVTTARPEAAAVTVAVLNDDVMLMPESMMPETPRPADSLTSAAAPKRRPVLPRRPESPPRHTATTRSTAAKPETFGNLGKRIEGIHVKRGRVGGRPLGREGGAAMICG